jgi:hypothetical protein
MKKLLLTLLILPSLSFAGGWECINRTALICNTWRMQVPTGWIVSNDNSAGGGVHGYGMVFVPDTAHEWRV